MFCLLIDFLQAFICYLWTLNSENDMISIHKTVLHRQQPRFPTAMYLVRCFCDNLHLSPFIHRLKRVIRQCLLLPFNKMVATIPNLLEAAVVTHKLQTIRIRIRPKTNWSTFRQATQIFAAVCYLARGMARYLHCDAQCQCFPN